MLTWNKLHKETREDIAWHGFEDNDDATYTCGCYHEYKGGLFAVELCDYHRGFNTALSGKSRKLKLEHYEGKDGPDGKWRWRVRHKSNGEIMAQGEGYKDKRDRDHATAVLFPDIEPTTLEALDD